MDNFHPQSGDLHLRGGHEEGDFSIRGIVLFVVVLVLSAILTLIAAAGLMKIFELAEQKFIDKPPTPVQQQLQERRGELAKKEGGKPQPDWYNREVDEKVLDKTFTTPRLQYNDASDMEAFRKKEEERLGSAGKNPDGSLYIPIDRAIDLVAKEGLPAVNGTFTPQPALGALESEAEAARQRVKQAGEQPQQPGRKK